MYKSPIEVIMHDLPAKIVKDEENMVLLEVRKQISVEVDEYELKKALAYDRNQYEKGFEDAKKQFEQPHAEAIYKDFDEESGISNSYWCSCCGFPIAQVYMSFCGNCGANLKEEGESE